MEVRHVLWIGGGQGSGKSSIARALAYRHRLQLYNVDHRVQAHVARAVPHVFHTLTMDQRWVEPDPEQMLAWFVEISRDRMRLVLEDLAELPPSPLCVVEGPQLFPSFVAPLLASRDQALFLAVPADGQRARLAARGPLTSTSQPDVARAKTIERDLLIADRIAREAHELGLAVLAVDRPLDAMIELADAHFAAAIARGPDGDVAPARRLENAALATQVRLYVANEGGAVSDELPFACECGCGAVVGLPLATYEQLGRVTAHVGLARGAVEVRDHDPEWTREFEREAARLRALLPAVPVEHVGSTAVPGLPAKPIVDIALAFPDRATLAAAADRLEAAGYVRGPDLGDEGGVTFAVGVERRWTHQLHLVEESDPQWPRYLAFRDGLRADAALRERYAALKRELAGRFPDDRVAYGAGKDAFISSATGRSP